MASLKGGDHNARTALHERHRGKGTVLWLDGHATSETLLSLGYKVEDNGAVSFDGNNRYFSLRREEGAWIEEAYQD